MQFIERYIEDAKRSYNYGQNSLNKEELGNDAKKMYDELMKRWL